MELPDIGKHCSLESCHMLDFLPLTCDACHRTFCKDHLEYSSHQCTQMHIKDRRVPVCPLCSQPISLAAHEDPDQKVNEHIDSHCTSDLAKHNSATRCRVNGCKKRELIPVLCATCKQNFCLRHRHENDHNCTAVSSGGGRQAGPSVRAGQAAASRFGASGSKKPTSSNSTNRPSVRSSQPQHTTMTNIGSDLNKQRQQRSMQPGNGTANASPSSTRMTDDEQLALAIAASLSSSDNTTTPQESTVPPGNVPNTGQEDMDAALARALRESEMEEQERRRREQQQQQQPQGGASPKNNCALS